MISGKTKSGFEYAIENNVFDNMELVDTIAEATEDDPVALSKLVKMVLGTEQRKKLYDHLRTEDGRVPTAAVFAAVGEIFTSFGQGKNS